MKNKIAILGSTGSIGKTLINILKKDKKNIEITLLTTNQNINELFKQVTIFNVKNVIIINLKKLMFIIVSTLLIKYLIIKLKMIML